jgi:hypothetical protein
MVRFSDMLGGSGEPDDAHAANSPYDALSDDRMADAEPEADDPDTDDEPEADPEGDADADEAGPETGTASDRVPDPTFESPEDVLDRLTQYATSARAAEPVKPPDEDAPDDDALPPVGDDFLPRAKGIEGKSGRSRKRRP